MLTCSCWVSNGIKIASNMNSLCVRESQAGWKVHLFLVLQERTRFTLASQKMLFNEDAED